MDSTNKQPLQISDPDGLNLDERQLRVAIWAVIGLGIALRLLRYLLNFPLWTDEGKLAVSFLDRGYLGLLAPLDYGQTGPIGFLWASLTAVKVFGFNEYALRLFPCLTGIASLFVMRRLSSRLLTGLPLLLAVALVSVSYYPVRLSADFKPYASDLFFAAILIALAIEWWTNQEKSRWLWILVLLGPLAIAMSNPAIFVAAGIGLGMLVSVWQSGRWSNRLAFGLFGALTVGTFVGSYYMLNQAQYEASVINAVTTEFWAAAFLPIDNPLAMPAWLLSAHTGRMFGYPIGFEGGGGAKVFVLFVIGTIVFYRARRRAVVTTLLLPFGMALVASALRMYPYGQSGRIAQWAVPAICVLASPGAAWIVSLFSSAKAREMIARSVVGFLIFFGLVLGVRDLVRPYMGKEDRSARDFARWFWVEKARDAELVCAWNDLELPFAKRPPAHILGNGQYWCNQRIYSPRLRRGEPANLKRVSKKHPLRVAFLESMINRPGNGFVEWLEETRTKYQQVGEERFKPAHYTDDASFEQEEVIVFEFEPRVSEEDKRSKREEARRNKAERKKKRRKKN